jgi:dTDP-4-amino-4,6-dideoxygalactose transaminase
MANGIYKITEEFERELCKYTGSPYAVALDSQSNAIFLSLYYERIQGKEISIPDRTYPSVPCEIIHAGGKVNFIKTDMANLADILPQIDNGTIKQFNAKYGEYKTKKPAIVNGLTDVVVCGDGTYHIVDVGLM